MGLALMSSSGTVSRLSVELRAVCLPPTEGFRFLLPVLQRSLARFVTSLRREGGATVVSDSDDPLTVFRRCFSEISHCRRVYKFASLKLLRADRKCMGRYLFNTAGFRLLVTRGRV